MYVLHTSLVFVLLVSLFSNTFIVSIAMHCFVSCVVCCYGVDNDDIVVVCVVYAVDDTRFVDIVVYVVVVAVVVVLSLLFILLLLLFVLSLLLFMLLLLLFLFLMLLLLLLL